MQIDIAIPYTTAARMSRNTGPLYNNIPDPRYLEQKKVELEKFGSDLYGETFEFTSNRLLAKSCSYLGLPVKHSILDFALMFEEDVAIMHQGKLSAICFCFPSGWIPAERIGMTLSEIHQPVADNNKLVSASDKLAKTMADPVLGSFRRQVWTVTVNPDLSNHPATRSKIEPNSINDLYLRVETQTTAPLGDGSSSLFFVKVDVYPLPDIWPTLGHRIKSSINSMTDSVLQYKHLENIKPLLNRVLLM